MFNNIQQELPKINANYSNGNIMLGGDFNARIDDDQLPYTSIFTKRRERQNDIFNYR